MDLARGSIVRTGGGGSVSAVADSASFPLHEAAREGRLRVVQRLLERGHSVLSLDGDGLRASERAREAGHHDLADELERLEAGRAAGLSRPPLIERLSIKELFSLVQGTRDAVVALISAGRIHAIDGKGDTPLHICAARGRLQLCDLLINAGADPSALNFEGKKAHERAAENGHTMVAGLLRSLLSEAEPGRTEALDPKSEGGVAKPIAPKPMPAAQKSDAFDFDDLDLDFEGEDEAEDYHRDIDRNDYIAYFDAVEERVTRLGHEDGADLDFDDLDEAGFRIEAEDIVGPLPQTAEFADAATFRSFLDVRMGRKSYDRASAPSTRYHAVADKTLLQWIEGVMAEGLCTDDDVDALIGSIRGSFDAETVRGNLVHELVALGLMRRENEDPDDAFVVEETPDPEDVADLLSCVCNGSNMRPGMEFWPLPARKEARLFSGLAASQRDIYRTLVSDARLVSIVVMLGERLEAGTPAPKLLTELDIQHGRQTPDAEVLSAALSYLVGYQSLLEEGDVTEKDRLHALEAVSLMKLSRVAVELIAQGIQKKPELDDARNRIEASLAIRERYRQEILLEHMPLVRRQASRREAYVDDVEDLVQDGVFGLMRSIDLFAPDRGKRFMTYCQIWVQQAIARAQDETGSLVRVPTQPALILRKVDRLEESIAEKLPAEALISLISKEMQIPSDTIRKLRRVPRRPVPFEEMTQDCLDVESPQFREYLARQREEIIEGFLSRMPERAADVIARRFGLRGEDEMTLEELGTIYGLTRERIRQIEAKRLREMGHQSHQRLLRSLL